MPNSFNNHVFFKNLYITSFVFNPNPVPCACTKFDVQYIDKDQQTS